jgi:hypothetical protein
MEHLEHSLSRRRQRWVAAVIKVISSHHLVMRGMFDGEEYEVDSKGKEGLGRVYIFAGAQLAVMKQSRAPAPLPRISLARRRSSGGFADS